MSARSRAQPWFGTRGERTPPRPLPPGVSAVTMLEAAWLGRFTPAPGTEPYITWAPGDREQAVAAGLYLNEPAFLAAVQARIERLRDVVWRDLEAAGLA